MAKQSSAMDLRSPSSSSTDLEPSASTSSVSGCRAVTAFVRTRGGPTEQDDISSTSSDSEAESFDQRTEVGPTKKKRRCGHRMSGFNLQWKEKYSWLYYVESEGMYCRWCKAHSVSGRGRATWTSKPCISYREDKIKAHMRSFSHKLASEQQAQAEESARSGGIRQSFETCVTVERKAFIKVMHWLAKEEIAHTTKFESLISLAVSIGAKELKSRSKGGNAKYTSERTMYEIIEVLSATIEEEILQVISTSPLISILCDESTDIAILKQLVVYVRYIKNGEVVTRFLKIQDLFDGTAVTIEAALIDILSKLQIPLEKVAAFGSDGAAVMIGRRNGVATKLKD